MYLREGVRAIWEAYLGYALAFTPSPGAINPSQSVKFTNPAADRNRLDSGYFSENLDWHALILSHTSVACVCQPNEEGLSGVRPRIPGKPG